MGLPNINWINNPWTTYSQWGGANPSLTQWNGMNNSWNNFNTNWSNPYYGATAPSFFGSGSSGSDSNSGETYEQYIARMKASFLPPKSNNNSAKASTVFTKREAEVLAEEYKRLIIDPPSESLTSSIGTQAAFGAAFAAKPTLDYMRSTQTRQTLAPVAREYTSKAWNESTWVDFIRPSDKFKENKAYNDAVSDLTKETVKLEKKISRRFGEKVEQKLYDAILKNSEAAIKSGDIKQVKEAIDFAKNARKVKTFEAFEKAFPEASAKITGKASAEVVAEGAATIEKAGSKVVTEGANAIIPAEEAFVFGDSGVTAATNGTKTGIGAAEGVAKSQNAITKNFFGDMTEEFGKGATAANGVGKGASKTAEQIVAKGAEGVAKSQNAIANNFFRDMEGGLGQTGTKVSESVGKATTKGAVNTQSTIATTFVKDMAEDLGQGCTTVSGAGNGVAKSAGKGILKRCTKYVPYIGDAIFAGMEIYGDWDKLKAAKKQGGGALAKQCVHTGVKTAAVVGGFALGMKVGAAIGSCVPIPVVGTLVGAVVGGIVGGFLSWFGAKAAKTATTAVLGPEPGVEAQKNELTSKKNNNYIDCNGTLNEKKFQNSGHCELITSLASIYAQNGTGENGISGEAAQILREHGYIA